MLSSNCSGIYYKYKYYILFREFNKYILGDFFFFWSNILYENVLVDISSSTEPPVNCCCFFLMVHVQIENLLNELRSTQALQLWSNQCLLGKAVFYSAWTRGHVKCLRFNYLSLLLIFLSLQQQEAKSGIQLLKNRHLYLHRCITN